LGNDRIIAGPGNDYIDGGRGFDTEYYTGVRSDYFILANPNGSWTVTDNRPGSPDGSDTLVSVEQLTFSNGVPNLFVPGPSITIGTAAPIPQDFNDDGTSDVILQSGGNVVDWIMTDGHYQSGNVISNGATGFTVVGTGDVNGDGTSDVLLQSGGNVVDWIMTDGRYQSGNVVSNGATGFTVVGT
jgi:hypothetical protein